jgi:hypothetical protein
VTRHPISLATDERRIAEYVLIHPNSIWNDCYTQIIRYEQDALVIPFTDLMGITGRKFPYRVEAGIHRG